MGANDQGVCAGYTSVCTKLSGTESKVLTPSDLTRLILERSSSAKSGVDIVTSLIDQYGQGGTLEAQNPLPYCGAFLLTDRNEVWVVECAGKFWVAKQITEGAYGISSCLSISTEYNLTSSNLQEESVARGHWSQEKGPVDFTLAFGEEFPTNLGCVDPVTRRRTGCDLLNNSVDQGSFSVMKMFNILRNKTSGINMNGHLVTTGSHVSVLSSAGLPDCHWFTATPDPSLSVFKPFLFSDNVDIGDTTQSLCNTVKRHILYKYHEKAREFMSSGTQEGKDLVQFMRNLEERCVSEMDQFCQKFSPENMSDIEELFKDMCESEVKFYL
ncbi:secernin-2-like isoform X2 [Saccostrea cucullata]|uniref:secernin-2-like isoform X2 n=1 Tax=Saccostrea cuccullata TaxID=36930 RepID=UPI002ED3ADEB